MIITIPQKDLIIGGLFIYTMFRVLKMEYMINLQTRSIDEILRIISSR